MVGRYAPSPTGDLHLGNLRTALLAWMFARSAGSAFLMRMEDLDSSRVRPGYAERQLADLASLGIDWDGPVVSQSQRGDLYAAALERLDAAGLLYECFCTRAEIHAAVEAPHEPLPEGAYPGTCRELSSAERARRAGTRPPALRVRAEAELVAFEDAVAGPQEGAVDDFVVRRNDGAIAYNLAVVADDGAQGVEQVVRGADLLSSTPRQIWLARRLGLPEPAHAHVSLVLGADGSRLAKRHGAVTLRELAPERALRWIAHSLGVAHAENAADLLDAFEPGRLDAAPVTFADDALDTN